MSDLNDPAYDFQSTIGANVDPDIGQSLATSYRMPAMSTEDELYSQAQKVHRVLWRMIATRNQRTWLRDHRVRETRRAVMQKMRENKVKIREADFQQDEIAINTRLAKIEADIRVDAEMNGEDPDLVMAGLHKEATAVEVVQ